MLFDLFDRAFSSLLLIVGMFGVYVIWKFLRRAEMLTDMDDDIREDWRAVRAAFRLNAQQLWDRIINKR